jgi:DNA-binding transcriptional regulator GbsR (MarR family)
VAVRFAPPRLSVGLIKSEMALDENMLTAQISVMTEMTDVRIRLSPTIEQFVLRWGDMGDQWGVNRSVAQIHALLYLAERPLHAEEIADSLGIARSNVSNSLRELLGWKLIHRIPVLGDRRDYYLAEADIWKIVMRIAQGRKEREFDPAVAAIRHVMTTAEDDPRLGKVPMARLREMESFLATINDWYDQMLTVPPDRIMALIRLGTRVVNFLGFGHGKKSKKGGKG